MLSLQANSLPKGKAIKIEINVVNTNRWFIGNPQSIFQKDLTNFIVMRHSEEEMV